jgi:serine/threonine protein kinase
LTYAAPEVLFGDPFMTPACDVWALGCVLYLVLDECDLWITVWKNAEIFPNLMSALGKSPDRWWQQWDAEERSKYFDDEGHPIPGACHWDSPMVRRINGLVERLENNAKESGEDEISSAHLEELKHIMHAIFKREPEERADAKAVVQALSWMQEYAEGSVGLRRRTWSWGLDILFRYLYGNGV